MTEDRIFGKTWAEIQAMQNGTYVAPTVDMSKTGKREPTERDRALLAEHGVAGLLEKKFLGTLDALDLMYSPVHTVLEEGQVWHCHDGSRVKLDRRVPGDATKWYVQDWWNGSWACMDSTIEPGDLLALADGEDPWAQAEDDAATERPEPIPDHEARWTARFPYIDDMGSVAPIHGVQDKGNETKEEEALWHLNDMRKHDGLPPRKSLPKGTTFERTTPRESVLVDFRVFPEGDVIALMPNIPETAGRIMSYMHMGQHSPTTPELRVTLRAATPEEYGPLLRELEQVGYAVRVWHDGEEEE